MLMRVNIRCHIACLFLNLYLCFIRLMLMVCSLLSAASLRFHHDAPSLLQATVVNDFAQMSSFWSYTTVPVAFRLPILCIFTNLEAQVRYLPIIKGAGIIIIQP